MEVAGVALATLPLVISAAEHYSSAARVVKQYRRFSSELEHLRRFLNIQRAIFHTHIRSLLIKCIDLDEAEELLRDPDDSRWQDKSLEESFSAQLKGTGTREAFLEVVDSINIELSEVEGRLNRFQEVSNLASKADINKDKEHRNCVKEKCRFILSQSQIQDSRRTLKDLLDDLATLLSQSEKTGQRRPNFQPSLQSRHMIEQFALVQKASQHLYDALRSSCTKHTHHQAHFSLQPIPSPKSDQVRFNLSFRQFIAPVSGVKQSVWFTVESTVKSVPSSPPSQNDTPTLINLTQSIKRGRPSASPPPQRQPSKLQKKRIRFQLPSSCNSPPLPDQLQTNNSIPPFVGPPLSNLCSHSNFCNHLQNFLKRSNTSADCCIGYLEKTPDSKHLIYLRGQDLKAGKQLDVPLKSLADILTQTQQRSDEALDIGQGERLDLSRKLAAAVLQFHLTPWLRNTWSSHDVFFLPQTTSSARQCAELEEPFVDVSVRESSNANADNDQTDPCYPFAPNDFLFGLGVMLLELAFQKPLQSMRKACDTVDGIDDRHALFFTAKRLSKTVSKKFGTRYGESVRKCLACDFGRGHDLSKPSLQEAVYREVVCELTDLVGALNLGP